MNDFKIIARLLAAIRASEESPVFDVALVDEKVLGATETQRDILAVKLQKAGYIEGLCIIDGVDKTVPYVLWERSKPSVTLEGLTWMQTNELFKKAVGEMKQISVNILGTPYSVERKDYKEDLLLEKYEGYCDKTNKRIVLGRLRPEDDSMDVKAEESRLLRHEIVHAFMYESGLDENSDWGTDETLIDWIAIQFPKIEKAIESGRHILEA